MWRDRRDDPDAAQRETQRLSRDEYDRPRYGSSPGDFVRHAADPQSSIESIRVHEIMTQRVATVHPGTPVERAAHLMAECDCGALPVIGENGVLVGIVTAQDFLAASARLFEERLGPRESPAPSGNIVGEEL